MIVKLSDLAPARRREEVGRAIEVTLAALMTAQPTADLVQSLASTLDATGYADTPDGRKMIARQLTELAPGHAQARSLGSYVRYGKTMQRWEWLPRSQVSSVPGQADAFAARQLDKPARHVAASLHGYSITYDPMDPATVLAAKRFGEWVEIIRAETELPGGTEAATGEGETDWTVS